ncbi:ecdysone oxidase-like [Dermacentor variabilis]|uniref:ecdysone oxidase-like n=1 Tax=Dermacentor variabilis TaxID=34621 RepID=UPI003F5B60B2
MEEQIYESYYKLKQGQNVLMIVPILLHPKSSGFIRLKSTDPEEYPIIDPQFLSNITDLDTLVAGAKIAVQTLKTQAMKSANVTIWDTALPACESAGPLWSDSYLRCFVQHTSLSGWHPCCTAPMGTHRLAVLDARLRVLGGVKKLRVVDASSMPYLPAGNLNAPLMMMGHRAAAMIIEDNPVQD